jgi:hypothetical protein
VHCLIMKSPAFGPGFLSTEGSDVRVVCAADCGTGCFSHPDLRACALSTFRRCLKSKRTPLLAHH